MGNSILLGRIVGRINLKRKRTGQNRSVEEENPFSIFKQGTGKPTPRDSYLSTRREHIICTVEPCWAEMGWVVICTRTSDDVRRAFGSISDASAGPLAPIVSLNSKPSTTESIRQVRRKLGAAVQSERSLGDLHQARLGSFQVAERRAYALSEEYKKQLKDDLFKRRKNIRQIEIEITTQKSQLRKEHLRKKSEKGPDRKAHNPEFSTVGDVLFKLERDRKAEERLCDALQKQIDSITPSSREIVASEAASRKQLLNATEQNLTEARRKSQELNRELQDQEAFFFQTQILAFIREGRYTVTPRTLADAIAGLPYMTARRSAERCAKLKSNVSVSRNYRTLTFIISAWNRRHKRGRLPLIDWFENEIRGMPKFQIVARKKVTNHFRAYFCEKWFYLKEAIKESSRLGLDSRAVPYAITSHFLKHISGLEDPLEATLAEAARITD